MSDLDSTEANSFAVKDRLIVAILIIIGATAGLLLDKIPSFDYAAIMGGTIWWGSNARAASMSTNEQLKRLL